jgi:hypothetical protein
VTTTSAPPASTITTDGPVREEILRGEGVPLPALARSLPPLRAGRPVSASTLGRWVNHGAHLPDGRLVRLEAARVGCHWVSSLAALERFLAALAGAEVPRAE